MPHRTWAARTRAPGLRNPALVLVTVILGSVAPTPVLAASGASPVPADPAPISDVTAAAELDWMWLKQEGTAQQDGAGQPAADGSLYFVGGDGAGGLVIRKVDSDGKNMWSKPFTTPAGTSAGPARMALTSTAIYISGTVTSGNMSTNPPSTPAGGADAFIRKYDLAGVEQWTRQFGTSADDYVSGVAVDPSGVYAVGHTLGAFSGETLQGASDVFVSKFNHAGSHQWTSQFGTAGADQSWGGLAVRNPTGGATATNGDGIYVAITATVATASWDSRIQALDLNGDADCPPDKCWSDQFDSGQFEQAMHIAVDHTGVYLAGLTDGTVPDEPVDVNEGTKSYIIKYSHSSPNPGARVKTVQFGAGSWPYFIETDGTGVYLAGHVAGALDGQTSAGGNDAYIRKYDTDLNLGATRQFGTAGNDSVQGLAIDHTGVYVTGDTSGSFPGYENAGSYDTFLAKLNIVPAPPRPVVEQLAAPTTVLGESQEPVKEIANQADPVNVLFGNFTHQHTDLATGGLGLSWTRTYNSAEPRSGLVGWGWSIAWDLRISTDADGFTTVTRGDGRVDRYRRLSGTAFEAPLGSLEVLTQASGGGNYRLLTRDRIRYTFSSTGRLLSATDADGNVIRLSYSGGKWTGIKDAAGRAWTIAYAGTRIGSVTDNSGRTVTYAYEADGDLKSVTDANGGVTSYQYDGRHRLTRITDPRGQLFVSHVYNADGRVVTQNDASGKHTFTYLPHQTIYTDPLGNRTTTHYDNNHRVTKAVDALGRATTMTYDSRGLLTSQTDALGRKTSYAYDARGNVTKVTNALGKATHMTYDVRGNLLTSTDALGRKTTYQYNAADHLTLVTDALGNKTTYTYTTTGFVETVTDDLSNTTTYAYDVNGNQTSVTDPLGNTTTLAYDAAGRTTMVTDPLGNKTRTEFDALGQVTKTTAPDGGTTLYTYDKAGNRTSIVDPRGNKTTFTYDSANRLVKVTNPLLKVTTYTYDAMGRRTATTLPNGTTSTTAYDAMGRPVAERTPLGLVRRYLYDKVGNLTRLIEPDGAATKFAYDPLNRTRTITDALGGVTRLFYDAVGNVTKMTDALGRNTTYLYDALNREKRSTDPLGRQFSTNYDDLGRIATTTNGADQVTTYTYDDAGRLVSVSSGGLVTLYAYDAAGRRTSMKHGKSGLPLATTTYTYDVANRVKSTDSPQGKVRYGYDIAGNRTHLSQPGQNITYAYDALGRLASVKRGAATVASYAYDVAGRLSKQTFGNGVITTTSYDADGRLTKLLTRKGTTVLLSVAYTLDKRGNRTAETSTGFTGTYGYDKLGRLTSASAQVTSAGGASIPKQTYTFDYDAVGNRETQTVNGIVTNYTYDAAYQLTTAGARSFTYDNAGRVTNDGQSTYAYDAFGRLAKTVGGGVTTTYGYDGDGNRVSETAAGATSAFLLDAAVPNAVRVATTTSTGTERYLYGLSRVAQVMTTGALRYEHSDGLGSVRLLTTPTGADAGRQNYEPFGARLNGTGAFGFTGEAYSDNGRLLHLRAREYDPSVGRFLSTDPHPANPMLPHTLNRYQYVGHSPVNATDPSGLYSYDDWEYTLWLDVANGWRDLCYEDGDSGACEMALQAFSTLYEYQDKIIQEEAQRAAASGATVASHLKPLDVSGDAGLTTGDLMASHTGTPLPSSSNNTASDGSVDADGGSLIGNDGSTLIGNDGSTLIGSDGGSLIGSDGGSLIGSDGGSLLGNNTATFTPRFSTYSLSSTGPESSGNKPATASGPGT